MSWKLREYKRSHLKIMDILNKEGELIAAFVADEKDYSKKKKKAQLMAAAPDMLESLKQSYEMIDTLAGMSSWDARSQDEIDEVMNQILNTMDKAKGVDNYDE